MDEVVGVATVGGYTLIFTRSGKIYRIYTTTSDRVGIELFMKMELG
jgi:hypothetical protein